MAILAIAFLIAALLYASVGFGGGSTYNALLVLSGTDYRILPSIALICNIIVVSGGVWRFSHAGHLNINRMLPWIAASIPAAWIGGRFPISEVFFVGALGLSLLLAGGQLLFDRNGGQTPGAHKNPPLLAQFVIGGAIGALSGLVGIGGGIFLAPILYFLRWGNPQQVAGACSFFILVNSISGLAGQVEKLSTIGGGALIADYWLVFPAVLLGGQIGSRLGSAILKPQVVKLLTAILILYVAVRLLLRWATLLSA